MSKVESKSKAKGSKKIQKKTEDEIDVNAILAEKEDVIAELNEKIRQLTIENEDLQKKIPAAAAAAKKRVSVVVAADPTSSPRTPRMKKQANRRKSLALINNDVESSPIINPRLNSTTSNKSTNSIKEKGCSCKGQCKTKICGCVKKGKPCSEACKCTDLCENGEDDDVFNEDKENNGDNKEENDIKQEQDYFYSDDEGDQQQIDDSSPDKNDENMENQHSGSSSGSCSSTISDSTQTDEETGFNPMKPTKTLARSPMANKSSSSSIGEKSPLASVVDNKQLKTKIKTSLSPRADESDSEGDDYDALKF